ncbi:MAG: NAD-binding protein [Acidobacteriota bacterium]
MKTLVAQLTSVVQSRHGERNMRSLARFFLILAAIVAIYSVLFHVLMEREGQEHTWLTGVYWTLTVMSTLGFGDITFHTDLGRLFSIVVLLSGTIFLLILLPFTFIEFFYTPWIAAQNAARAPRQLPAKTRGHVLITSYDSVAQPLIRRLTQYDFEYAVLVPEVEEALQLHDLDVRVMVGALDDPKAWTQARVDQAALVVSTASDVTNTNVAFTVRALAPDLPILVSAKDEASVDILNLAGSSEVLRLEEMIGQSFARRTVGGDAMTHPIGEFGDLVIAEAGAHCTPLVGKTLVETKVREHLGVTVVGIWERGRFEVASAQTRLRDNSVLLLAGSKESMYRYDEFFCIYNVSIAPVVILGGGRVGRSTARSLAQRDVDYRIVEIVPDRVEDPERTIIGSAADLDVLEAAGIRDTSTVIITTHEDELNVYLTIYCRQLRPDIQILCRATHDRNVATLHRAGADIVLSYASTGVNAVMNQLQRQQILMVAEGLYLFELTVPDELAGRTLAHCGVRERTGCSIVAIRRGEDIEVVSDPGEIFKAGTEIILVGTAEAQERFLDLYRT